MELNKNYLPHSDVVFTVMFLNKTLCEKTLEIVLGESIELVDIVSESKNNLHLAAMNDIYFDIKTKAKDGRIVTLDLQRKYLKDRVRKRTVYYACREICDQKVKHGQYENLKSVVVTFILTEASLDTTSDNSCILLKNDVTGELYTDILSIHEINMKHVDNSNDFELQILKAFFDIDEQDKLDNFEKKFGNTYYGKLLLESYITATSDISLLNCLCEEEKFMIRLTEEERIMEQEIGEKRKAIEIALKMLSSNMNLSKISEITGLSKEEIENLHVS